MRYNSEVMCAWFWFWFLYLTLQGGRGRGGHGAPGGAGIEQYYKHSMVEDPWRTLIQNSQQTESTS